MCSVLGYRFICELLELWSGLGDDPDAGEGGAGLVCVVDMWDTRQNIHHQVSKERRQKSGTFSVAIC